MFRVLLCAAIISAISTHTVSAAELCLKNSVRLSNAGRLNLKKALRVADGCTAKETSLLNTADLVGTAGQAGPQGPMGPQGEPGPFVETLPSGQTLRGEFRLGALAPESVSGFISFPFPLAETPILRWSASESPNDPACPGTAANPEAAPGYFCLYTPPSYTQNWTVIDFGNALTRFGFRLKVTGTGNFYMGGGWAVTAP